MKSTLLSSVAVVALLAASMPAHAVTIGSNSGPDPFTLSFDENGNGLLNGTTVDRGYIDANGFLAYNLPSAVGLGDVAIADPQVTCTSAATCSDGLRFTIVNGLYVMEFMSADKNGGQLADTGFASTFNFSFVGATEAANGSFSYLCHGTNCYQGLSEVPEPASLGILGAALVGFGAIRRRRRAV
jgi:hypothetical protein